MEKFRLVMKIFLVAMAIAMIFFCISTCLTSCNCETTESQFEDNNTENVIGKYEGDFQYQYHKSKVRGVINKIEYDGHEYIIFTDRTGIAITHNPYCPCNNRYE